MEVYILALAFVGLLLSSYIFYKKKKNEKLVCLIGDDCNKVINSKYSHIFGIDNEILGISYYIFVIIFIILLLSGIEIIFLISTIFILLLSGVIAALFSSILTIIQLFILKEWCEYCLATAVISIAIFALELKLLF